MRLSFNNKTYSDSILSCSVGFDFGQLVYEFNDDGPVYGPNGEWELDPDNDLCGDFDRPVFSTCKNNCPGGELCYHLSADKMNVFLHLRKYISCHQQIILK